jgi:intracellular sulfur oxidation DsrE/DsrF family protein
MEAIRYRAVFQLDDEEPDRVQLTLANIRNVIEELGQTNVEIILVINGLALRAFQGDSPHIGLLDDLKGKGVGFRACRRSLRKCDLAESDLLKHFSFVSSGVTELIRKQNEGWAYIHP